ncbi:hypothetical protein GOP47_0015666 [Adiantum capillus-veneris]|uniref:Uncharacterized protein n=1 Tax=Adiantum capillus-veneris TaxID=13818 RepID=A0A9D4UK71_ADICA|nr:hypothetical protein GOP47_0015666 [Adiantum capillus-veneris]
MFFLYLIGRDQLYRNCHNNTDKCLPGHKLREFVPACTRPMDFVTYNKKAQQFLKIAEFNRAIFLSATFADFLGKHSFLLV